MKITGYRTRLVDIPLTKRITTSIHDMRSVGCVLLSLETDAGLVGEGYAFTLNALRLQALNQIVTSYADQAVGKDPAFVEGICDAIRKEMNPIGNKGLAVAGLTPLDVACWDLLGKSANQPLHRLFGACRQRIKTYASGGLWLSQSIDSLVEEANEFIAFGFRSMKIRLGCARQRDDVMRAAAVREAIGDDIELLADVNQGLAVKQAIRLGKALEDLNLGWIEEPVAYHNLRGHAEVRQALTTAVASGETEYTRFGMHDYLSADAVDILMPDLQRMGGLSEMRRAAAIASVYHTPVSTHLFTEHSLCFAGSEPGCISVEHMPWFAPLFNEEMPVEEGQIAIPDRPGTGFTFNPDAVSEFEISG